MQHLALNLLLMLIVGCVLYLNTALAPVQQSEPNNSCWIPETAQITTNPTRC